MKSVSLISKLGVSLSTFYFIAAAQAGIPVWSFTPSAAFPPNIFVSASGSSTVQYTVTNNSYRLHNLVIKPQRGLIQNGPCFVGPAGSANSSCLLNLTVNGAALTSGGFTGGPELCQVNGNGTPNPNECYRPSPVNSLAVTLIPNPLTTSIANLALSVTGLTLNGLPSGQPRTITITNTGSRTVTGVTVNFPTFPAGTTAISTCGSSLAAGATCTIRVAPGAAASSACTTGTAAAPSVITVVGQGAQISTNVFVLGYSCIYQGGYIYSLIENPNTTHSVGGSITALTDEESLSPGVIWSSNGAGSTGGTGSNDLIPGISTVSTTTTPDPSYTPNFTSFFAATYTNTNPFVSTDFASCTGASDGHCNSNNILFFYNNLTTNFLSLGTPPFTATLAPTPLGDYAAGICSQYTIDNAGNVPCVTGNTCYTNWYLPSVCEMGPSVSAVCLPGTIQNISANIPSLIGSSTSSSPSTSCSLGANCLAGTYWSSTEPAATSTPQSHAEARDFETGAGSNLVATKSSQLAVRCSRPLTTT